MLGGLRAMMIWLATGALWAAPSLTTIQDVLYKADGSLFNGLLFIEWRGFETQEGSNIPTQRVTVKVVNGVLRVQLAPTTTATPPTFYRVRYSSDGRVQFEETWAVPPSARPLRVREVRVATGAAQGDLIGIGDVAGLTEALDARPAKGAGYAPGRVALINANGELVAAPGNPSDCLRVDGSAGPCGAGSGGAGSFVDAETPSGVVDGSNATFTLSAAPAPQTGLMLYRNGLLQKQGLDYTLNGNVIQFAPGAVPQPGDVLTANYRVVGEAAESATATAEVLCSGTGGTTGDTVLTRLGGCTLPANSLNPGDRVEIRFDFSHQGTGSGLAIALRWGATTLESRDAHAGVALISGRAEAAVRTAGVQWSTQSWGSALSLSTNAGVATDPLSAPLTIELLGRLTAAGSDTLTLENYTVLRYPAVPVQ